MYSVKKTWLCGYVMLPCFTIRELKGTGEPELTCSDFLQWLFEKVFARFWTGKVWITHEITEGETDEYLQ